MLEASYLCNMQYFANRSVVAAVTITNISLIVHSLFHLFAVILSGWLAAVISHVS